MDQLIKVGPLAALIRLWNELTSSQRVVVSAFLAVSAVVIVIIGTAASKPRMTVLFSRLEPEDAGAIVQKLSEQKVPYKLSADNSTIEVPEGQVDDLRLQMVTAGLPQGGTVGFELFDKSSFGMTEFQQRVGYQRAIQGELTRTIEHLAPVVNARVHLAIPADRVYESEQEPVTASVVLKVRRGMPLTDDQVGGVVHLVSSAVEGLKPSNVTVIDSEGGVLSEALTADSSGGGQMLTANQSKLKRQYESELAANLQSMLARIVGGDKAVVRVSADMNFDHRQTKSEKYEPVASAAGRGLAQGVIVSEEKKSELYSGAQVPTGAAPNRRQGGISAGDTYTHMESNSQYQVTKVLEETVSAPGQLKRLSVAVLVDDKVDITKVAAIKEAVTAAAGIDTARNDQVTVQRIAFDTSAKKAEESEAASASKSQMIQTVGKNVAGVLLLFAFLFVLKGIVKQIRVQAPTVPVQAMAMAAAAPAPRTPTMAEMLAEQQAMPYIPPETTAAIEEKFSTAAPAEPPPPEVAQSSPEDLAKLIRTWISE